MAGSGTRARPHGSRPRLSDVAEEAGVSIATASRALSGAAGVSESMADRVRTVAAELGYVANLHARTLAGGPTSVVGLVVHEIGDPYFAEIASGVLGLAAAEGLTVQICHSGRDPEAELTQIRTLIANGVGAVIVAGSGFVDREIRAKVTATLKSYLADGGRVAVIGRHHLAVDTVQPENDKGGHAIAEHVVSLGHRRIGIISGSRALTTIHDRLGGMDRALQAVGLGVASTPLVEAAFTRDGGKEAALELLERAPDVTAIMALNDDMAIGALSVLRDRGIPVPGQISVTGFDDVAVAQDLAPSLTTVRLPMGEMGRQALELALSPAAKRSRRRTARAELIVRASTAAPRT
ncbi:LacI family DNA-binding transcriptional regulator [Ornithinimicrobium cavernae]|uniref:LacI family DNA-binding transcriptional regulator n=1 Tax=Ornithinimicrobium cavernae TaxID=2666047 RepID=UPI000D69B9AE|nr:LacI family DNA-binding transcriptional regulator [Ornithinimicrobium cavernae]